jgi:hypothetical protein
MPVTARVVDADDVATSVALFGAATEHCRPALYEIGQDTTLLFRGR